MTIRQKPLTARGRSNYDRIFRKPGIRPGLRELVESMEVFRNPFSPYVAKLWGDERVRELIESMADDAPNYDAPVGKDVPYEAD